MRNNHFFVQLLISFILSNLLIAQNTTIEKCFYHSINIGCSEKFKDFEENTTYTKNIGNLSYALKFNQKEFRFSFYKFYNNNNLFINEEWYMAQYGHNFKYFGFNIGALYQYPSSSFFPVGELRIGDIKNQYLSLHFANEESIPAIGVKFYIKYENPYDYLAFGAIGNEEWYINTAFRKSLFNLLLITVDYTFKINLLYVGLGYYIIL